MSNSDDEKQVFVKSHSRKVNGATGGYVNILSHLRKSRNNNDSKLKHDQSLENNERSYCRNHCEQSIRYSNSNEAWVIPTNNHKQQKNSTWSNPTYNLVNHKQDYFSNFDYLAGCMTYADSDCNSLSGDLNFENNSDLGTSNKVSCVTSVTDKEQDSDSYSRLSYIQTVTDSENISYLGNQAVFAAPDKVIHQAFHSEYSNGPRTIHLSKSTYLDGIKELMSLGKDGKVTIQLADCDISNDLLNTLSEIYKLTYLTKHERDMMLYLK